MLLKLDPTELEASALNIAKELAVLPVDLIGTSLSTVDVVFRTKPSPDGQPGALHRFRIQPEDLDLLDRMWRAMYARAKRGPGPSSGQSKH